MKRRALLASIAATGGVAGTAGCLQSPGAPAETTTDDTETTTDSDSEPGTGDGGTTGEDDRRTDDDGATDDDGTAGEPEEWDPTGEPVATLGINDRDGLSFLDNNQPHSLVLWNAVEREREVRVEWGDGRTEELERLDAAAVPADGLLQVNLLLPTRYDVVVRVDGSVVGEHAVGRGEFDCNQSASRLGLTETDLVDYGVVSTAAGCPAPSVADTTLSAGEGDCKDGTGEDVVAGYGDEVVTVDGTFVTPDPCHELAIADVAYDGRSRTARIVVEATPSGGACVECVGTVDYEATVTYEQDFPDRVVVVHRSGDDERRVATAAWNAGA